jgi:PAS domain S-box-containing protein
MLKKKQTLLHLATILFVLLNFTINSQSFLITKYSTDTGLPDNCINDIAQDSLGRIWVAMASGIAMYDGVEWKQFDEKDGVPEIEYIKIKIDEKGIIWFLPKQIYKQSLVFIDSETLGKLDLKSDVNNNSGLTNSFEINYKYNKLQIYISRINRGLLFYENGTWKTIKKKQGLVCDTITNIVKVDGKIFVSTFKGVSIISGEKVIQNIYLKNQQFNTQIMGLTKAFFKDNKHGKVFVFGADWIGDIHNYEIFVHKKNIRLPSLGFNDSHFIATDNENLVIFGNSSLLYSYNSHFNTVNRIILESPQSDRGGSSVLVDYEKNIWISSLRGIYKLTQSPFNNFIKSKGLPEIEVSAISQFNTGEMVFGHNYGVTVIHDNKIVYHEIASPENTKTLISRITSIYHDEINDLMYLTSVQGGIFVLSKNGIIRQQKIKNVTRYAFTYSYVKGGVVVFTDKGFYGFGNDLEYKIANTILLRKSILFNDKEYLLGTTCGVFKWKYDEKKVTMIRNSSKLNIFSIIKENEQNFLFGTLNGLYKLQGDSLAKFNFNGQDINDPIYFIVQDSVKNIWLGTNNGVLKWDGKYLKRYNKSDGLAGNETNRAAGFIDSKGYVWIGTDEGVSMYTGNEPDYSSFPPKVLLLDFKDHSNSSYKINNDISVDPDKNNLTFYYRGLSFLDEKRNSYQIKLTEVDGEYKNEFTTRYTSIRFNSLAAGDYIFSVRVQNSKGIWSDWKNSSVITINKYYYQEPLFIIGSILLSLFVLYYIYEYLQQKKYAIKLEKEVDSRTKSLKDYQSKLITTVERYKGIVESQSDLVVRVDAQYNFTFVNDAYCKAFGKSSKELLGNSFTPLVHPEDVDVTLDEMKKLTTPPHRAIMEQRALTTDGYRWFAWEDYAIMDENGNIKEIQGVGKDITIKKELEIELEKRVKERTTELRALISQSPFGIMIFNNEGDLIDFNTSADNLFKDSGSFSLSKYCHNIFEDEFLIKNNYNLRLHNLSSGSGLLVTSKIYIDKPETEIYKSLIRHYLIYRIYIIDYDDGNMNIVLLIEDITEQQKKEETSKKLEEEKVRVAAIIKTIESERERITRELHDGLGQLLTTAKLKLEIVKIKSADNNSEISEALSLLLSAGDEIRRIINDLKPSDVESFGLAAGVEILFEKMKQNTGINVEYSIINYRSPSNKKIEITIYRIIQEAFNNILKHSKCKNAGVSLNGSENGLEIKIWDDGIGADKILLSKHQGGFGIPNIEQRTKNLGGTFNIITSPGNGLKIIINIPII